MQSYAGDPAKILTLDGIKFAGCRSKSNSRTSSKFTPDEKTKYEERLKYYRDLKNVVDTSFDEGKAEGKYEQNLEIAREMKMKGVATTLIAEITGLSVSDIDSI